MPSKHSQPGEADIGLKDHPISWMNFGIEEYGSFPEMGRPSHIMNDDNYDYAIELRPDDEYRQAAEALPNIEEFDDEQLFLGSSSPTRPKHGASRSNSPVRATNRNDIAHSSSSPIPATSPFTPQQGQNSSRRNTVLASLQRSAVAVAKRLSLTVRRPNILSVDTNSGDEAGPAGNGFGISPQCVDIELGNTPPPPVAAPSHSNNRTSHNSPVVNKTSTTTGVGAGAGAGSPMRPGSRRYESNTIVDADAAARVSKRVASGLLGETGYSPASPVPDADGQHHAVGAAALAPQELLFPGQSQEEEQGQGQGQVLRPSERISQSDFFAKMKLISNKVRWLERSTEEYYKERSLETRSYLVSPSPTNGTAKMRRDKAVMDMLLVALAGEGGVVVRRHQGRYQSELVKLFSTDGCQSILWEPVLRGRGKGGDDGSSEDDDGVDGDSCGLSCCTKLWGCGEGLDTEADGAHNEAHRKSSSSSSASNDAGFVYNSGLYVEKGKDIVKPGWMHYMGYHRRGRFADLDILAVHPATLEDPTCKGLSGTESLRQSKDPHNSSLTLSVVINCAVSISGYATLDIECTDKQTYKLLFRGFSLLLRDAQEKRIAQENETVSDKFKKRLESVSSLWNVAKERVLMSASAAAKKKKMKGRINPVTALFEGNRTMMLGGTLDPCTHMVSNIFSPGTVRRKMMKTGGGGGTLLPMAQISPFKGDGEGGGDRGVGVPGTPNLPPAQFLGWYSAGTQIWARLKMAGLEVKCVFCWDLRRIILKIRCPQWRLEEVAEKMHMKLRNRDGTIKRFKVSRRDTFTRDSHSGQLFRSTERQQIIDFIIRSKIKDGGAELDEHTELGVHVVQRFPLHMYARLYDIRHSWVTFWKQGPPGVAAAPWSPFSTSLETTVDKFNTAMRHITSNILKQPLGNIAEYFGEKIAFYFAYKAFYTRCLIVPSILGVIVFGVQMHHGLDNWLCLPYSVSIMVWACFLLVFWRQQASILAYEWGVLEFEAEETERPQFQAAYSVDDHFLGEKRKVYPNWRRALLRYSFTIPVVLVSLVIILLIMSTVFSTQDKLLYEYSSHIPLDFHPVISLGTPLYYTSHSAYTTSSAIGGTVTGALYNSSMPLGGVTSPGAWGKMKLSRSNLADADFWSVMFLYPCIYGILVDISVKIFAQVAFILNKFENHRTETAFMNRLVLKVFSFQFITIFTSLFYYAFFMSDREGAFVRMSVTIFCLMTVGQWWGALTSICVPALAFRLTYYRLKVNVLLANRKIYRAREYADALGDKKNAKALKEAIDKRARYLEQARSKVWEEALQFRYDTFHDYATLIFQLCFVLFFSGVFPLAPLIAFLNNIVLLRVSAYKLCYTRQRPVAQKASGIGVWEDVLQVMSVVGVLTNCGIMGYTSTQLQTHLKSFGAAGIAIVLFALEHSILLLKYWLHTTIPRIPLTIVRKQARERLSVGKRRLIKHEARRKKRTMSVARGETPYSPDRDPDNDHDYNGPHDPDADTTFGGGTCTSVGDDENNDDGMSMHGRELDYNSRSPSSMSQWSQGGVGSPPAACARSSPNTRIHDALLHDENKDTDTDSVDRLTACGDGFDCRQLSPSDSSSGGGGREEEEGDVVAVAAVAAGRRRSPGTRHSTGQLYHNYNNAGNTDPGDTSNPSTTAAADDDYMCLLTQSAKKSRVSWAGDLVSTHTFRSKCDYQMRTLISLTEEEYLADQTDISDAAQISFQLLQSPVHTTQHTRAYGNDAQENMLFSPESALACVSYEDHVIDLAAIHLIPKSSTSSGSGNSNIICAQPTTTSQLLLSSSHLPGASYANNHDNEEKYGDDDDASDAEVGEEEDDDDYFSVGGHNLKEYSENRKHRRRSSAAAAAAKQGHQHYRLPLDATHPQNALDTATKPLHTSGVLTPGKEEEGREEEEDAEERSSSSSSDDSDTSTSSSSSSTDDDRHARISKRYSLENRPNGNRSSKLLNSKPSTTAGTAAAATADGGTRRIRESTRSSASYSGRRGVTDFGDDGEEDDDDDDDPFAQYHDRSSNSRLSWSSGFYSRPSALFGTVSRGGSLAAASGTTTAAGGTAASSNSLLQDGSSPSPFNSPSPTRVRNKRTSSSASIPAHMVMGSHTTAVLSSKVLGLTTPVANRTNNHEAAASIQKDREEEEEEGEEVAAAYSGGASPSDIAIAQKTLQTHAHTTTQSPKERITSPQSDSWASSFASRLLGLQREVQDHLQREQQQRVETERKAVSPVHVRHQLNIEGSATLTARAVSPAPLSPTPRALSPTPMPLTPRALSPIQLSVSMTQRSRSTSPQRELSPVARRDTSSLRPPLCLDGNTTSPISAAAPTTVAALVAAAEAQLRQVAQTIVPVSLLATATTAEKKRLSFGIPSQPFTRTTLFSNQEAVLRELASRGNTPLRRRSNSPVRCTSAPPASMQQLQQLRSPEDSDALSPGGHFSASMSVVSMPATLLQPVRAISPVPITPVKPGQTPTTPVKSGVKRTPQARSAGKVASGLTPSVAMTLEQKLASLEAVLSGGTPVRTSSQASLTNAPPRSLSPVPIHSNWSTAATASAFPATTTAITATTAATGTFAAIATSASATATAVIGSSAAAAGQNTSSSSEHSENVPGLANIQQPHSSSPMQPSSAMKITPMKSASVPAATAATSVTTPSHSIRPPVRTTHAPQQRGAPPPRTGTAAAIAAAAGGGGPGAAVSVRFADVASPLGNTTPLRSAMAGSRAKSQQQTLPSSPRGTHAQTLTSSSLSSATATATRQGSHNYQQQGGNRQNKYQQQSDIPLPPSVVSARIKQQTFSQNDVQGESTPVSPGKKPTAPSSNGQQQQQKNIVLSPGAAAAARSLRGAGAAAGSSTDGHTPLPQAESPFAFLVKNTNSTAATAAAVVTSPTANTAVSPKPQTSTVTVAANLSRAFEFATSSNNASAATTMMTDANSSSSAAAAAAEMKRFSCASNVSSVTDNSAGYGNADFTSHAKSKPTPRSTSPKQASSTPVASNPFLFALNNNNR